MWSTITAIVGTFEEVGVTGSRRVAAVLVVVGALLAGCGGSSATKTTASGCIAPDKQPKPAKKASYEKPETVLTGAPARIVMTTSCGVITIALDQKAGGPIPNAIAFLASKGFYDGLTFHRVVENFVLQGGDPNGNGTGDAGFEVVGTVPKGYTYKVGDVAMAKTSQAPSGSSGSQFFIVSAPAGGAALTSQPVYGILGHATDPTSLATINRIAALAVPGEQAAPPSQPVWIVSATVEQ